MDYEKIKPLSNRIAVKREPVKDKTEGGIIIPEMAKTQSVVARVVAAGPGRPINGGDRTAMTVKVGDQVILGHWKGDEVTIDEEKILMISEDDVLAICDYS
jgi:chaperonin GroES